MRGPLRASVTIWEATAPVKLPTSHRPRGLRVRMDRSEEWYFTVASRAPARARSPAPTYPTHRSDLSDGKL